jgi:GNAT superfamily N-acetyltransferase
MECTLTVTDVADEAIRKSMMAPLMAYNDSQAGPARGRRLVVQMRDDTKAVVGGFWGYTTYGWLFTEILVVPSSSRGQGVGSKLMQLAENEAVARGCHGAWVDTFEFQARGFYERMGYVCFGELADCPKGFSRFFMKKELRLHA